MAWWQLPRDNRSAFLQLARRSQNHQGLFIHNTIQQRMLQRSQCMRLPEGWVVDVSWGGQAQARDLQRRYQDRQVHVMSWSKKPVMSWSELLRQTVIKSFPSSVSSVFFGRGWVRPLQWHEFQTDKLGADHLNHLLPAGLSQKVAMIWSNSLLHRLADPVATIKSWHNALASNGVLFFSCFGPDTAYELRELSQALGLPFADWRDMHDWGDALVHTGFTDPVMEMERLTLTYRDVKQLFEDWRAAGGNCLLHRRQGCLGSSALKRCYALLEAADQGRLQMTIEVIYGHAWRTERVFKGAEVRIPVEKIGRKQ